MWPNGLGTWESKYDISASNVTSYIKKKDVQLQCWIVSESFIVQHFHKPFFFQGSLSTQCHCWTALWPTSFARSCSGDALTTTTPSSRACWTISHRWPTWRAPFGLWYNIQTNPNYVQIDMNYDGWNRQTPCCFQTAVRFLPRAHAAPSRASQPHLQQLQITGGINQGRSREAQVGPGPQQPSRLHRRLPDREGSTSLTVTVM